MNQVKTTHNSRNIEFEGDVRQWPYSKDAIVVRHINCYDDRYPVIRGEDINGVTVTDYKIEICLKDESRPSLIFLLKDNFISTD